ncbi:MULTISPECIES: acyltransferase family protein [Yersinia]|uniref:acyltransferase family protein n=1 Tax=Yersinia TaxID=629 RepID=UPI0005DD6268|nr:MULTISPECIES: acyltransferase [Yersinia]ARB84109.1 acyltransferase [Yersinia sp. FDAARGOS_228]AVL37902.1 acyltransferase [Yersinia intermedia]CNC79762.1 Acyltransferase family [Yersinia intermedia]
MIKSVHQLRGIASLFVVFVHLKFLLNDTYAQKNLGDMLFSSGYFGVDLFFMISGFVIVYSTKNDDSILSFSVKRLFKIYPVYLFCMALFVVINYPNVIEIAVIKSLLFLQLDYNSAAPFYAYSFIITAWTLTYELIFYVFFLIALKISHRYRILISSVMMLSVFSYLNIKYNGYLTLDPTTTLNFTASNSIQGLIKNLANPILIEFILGMIACEIYMRIRTDNEILKSASDFIFYSSLGVFLFYTFGGGASGHGVTNVGLGCFLLLVASVIREKIKGVRDNKYLNFLGDISYPLYLIHPIIMAFIPLHSNFFQLYTQTSGFGKFIYLLFSSIFVSYLIHIAIENNTSKVARAIINKLKTKD